MKYLNKKTIPIIDLLLLMAAFVLISPFASAGHDEAFADELSDISGSSNGNSATSSTDLTYPYTRTFTISAYYSPLPCQQRYVTGSYDGDVRLNGEGVHTADGSLVYPGLIAAPRNYQFGTKMDVPGIGIVAVHDRGGAIVASNGEGYYDRLDVWMGYGDKGLKRALNWGKRTIEAVVYGVNDSISEQIILDGYSAEESTPNECIYVATDNNEPISTVTEKPKIVTASVAAESVIDNFLNADLKLGDSGDKVTVLQNQLRKINLYHAEITGYYGDVTKHAVFKFQQMQGIITDEKSVHAGVFGPKTRDAMNEFVAIHNYSQVQIAQATSKYQSVILAQEMNRPRKRILTAELKYGMRGHEVAELQKFLKANGFFNGALITQYYGPVTKKAVMKFQKAHNLIGSESDNGAGHVGPATLELINTLS